MARGQRSERGQVVVIVAVAMVVLLGASAFTIDLGRRAAEERFLQNAADAAALAACNAMIDGASNAVALQEGRDVAALNLAKSPSGSGATIAAAGAETFVSGYHGNPVQMTNGAMVANESVYVAINSDVDTTVGRVLGRQSFGALGRARCGLEAEPALPFTIRRYQNPPGPGNGFVDHVATEATSGSGGVDPTSPRGYDGRTPASELAPGPEFQMYGPSSQATNNSFRGFIALDVRDFTHATSRKYYNGATSTMSSNVLKNHHADYIDDPDGYPGPGFAAVQNPPTGATQVGILNGVSAAQSSDRFSDKYAEGDRIMFAIYNGTVMAIPDFAIQPPVELELPATTTAPVDAPTPFEVSRNSAFTSSVTFRLVGDADASATGHPEYDILPSPSVTPPAVGQTNEPTFSPNGFVPATNGTDVTMLDFSTNDVPEGIYTVWLEGEAGAPYYQTRRQPVSVRVGTVDSEFTLDGSVVDGTIEALGGSVTLPIRVGSVAWNDGPGVATDVALSWDPTSLTNCAYSPVSLGTGTITFGSSSVAPTTSNAANSSLTINAGSLGSGCYLFVMRAHGVNADGEPVVRLRHVQFSVAATSGPSEYIDILGFAVFEITDANPNSFSGRAITGVNADPNAYELRAAQRPRLIPWN